MSKKFLTSMPEKLTLVTCVFQWFPEDIYRVNQMQQLGKDRGAALPVNIIESFDAFMGEKQHSIVGINN